MIVDNDRGLGDATSQDVSTVAAGISTVSGIAAATASAGLISLGFASVAIPFVGPVLALGVAIYSIFHNSKTAGEKTATSAKADQVEQYMQKNVDAWNSSDKSCTTQQAALANFDQLWQALVSYCQQIGDDPGRNCVDDRKGTRNGGNGKYDWYAYYRDPIANAQCSTPSVGGSIQDAITSATSSSGLTQQEIMLGLLGIGLVLLL